MSRLPQNELFAQMARTGLYDLSPESNIYWELTAYGHGLALAYAQIADIRQTAQTEKLERDKLCRMLAAFGFTAPAQTSESQLVRYLRTLLAPRGYTIKELRDHLAGLDTDVTLAEHPEIRRITVQVQSLGPLFAGPEELAAYLESLLPPDIRCGVEFDAVSWNELDRYDSTAANWDQKEFCWAQFDLYGKLLIE